MKRNVFLLVGIALLGGCASPWVAYQEAVRCHLDDKGPECDAKYQKAIKQNTKMPGVHASYGTHLLLQGKADQAAEEFKREQENFPTESSKAIALLLNPTTGISAAEASAPAAPPIDTTTKASSTESMKPAPSSTGKSVSTPSKAAPAKKGANRAK